MQVKVVVEADPVHHREAGLRALRLGHRDRAIELDDRRPRAARELAVEGGDLRPVRRILSVERGDRSLQDVGPAAA